MLNNKLIIPYAKQISPTSIRDYAKSRGWVKVEGSKKRLWIFRHPEEELRQLIIPIDRDDYDWPDSLWEIILRLADYEGLSANQMLDNLISAKSDVIRFRVSGASVEAGTLPMADAAILIEGAKRALLSSACSVYNHVKHHARMSRNESDDFLRVCKMGQTEIGSYVVKVLCPLTEMDEPPLLQEAQPFARETTMLLMNACNKIVNSIEQDNIDDMIEKDSEKPEVTSNLCNALLRMHGAREKEDLSVEISWAGMPNLCKPDIMPRATFKAEYFSEVEQIEKKLRPQKEQDERNLFIGTVETLNGNVGDDGRRSGDVTFALLLPDEELITAHGHLNSDDYDVAVKAHEEGKGYVSFTGILKRGARKNAIDAINEFNTLPFSASANK
jgi:hypothetical protein